MRRIWRMATVAAALALAAGAAGGAHAETPAERAWRNYELLRSGAKKPGDLSDVESEGGNPSDLAMRVIDLKCSQR